MKTQSTILSCLAVLALCAWSAVGAPPDHAAGTALSARPVEAIDAQVSLPGSVRVPVQFKPGTVRLRLPSDSVDLPISDIRGARFAAGTLPLRDSETDSDQCTIVTVRGDVLVGRCPFREFRRLLKADSAEAISGDAEPVAIAFTHHDAGTAPDLPAPTADGDAPRWMLKLANGSLLHIRPGADILRLEDANGPVQVPAALVDSIVREPTADLLDVRLVDAPYAIQCYRPRHDLQVTALDDASMDFPWDEILWVSRSPDGLSTAATHAQRISAAFPGQEAEPAVLEIPVTVLSLQFPAGNLLIPSTRISSISLNPDRTHTLVTAAGDILTGKIAFPDISFDAPDGHSVRIDKVSSIRFLDTVEVPLPENALAWRFVSGDVLVAVRDGGDAAPAAARPALPSSAAPVGRIAAAQRVAGAGPALRSSIPQQAVDGTWPEKRYAIRPFASSGTLDIPSKFLETVAPLPVSSLPPVTIPTGSSAFVTDEIVFPGGEFHLGRTVGTGAADEIPSAFIQIAPFAMSATPVTVSQFRAFVEDTGYVTTSELMSGFSTWKTPGFAQSGDHPVVCVSWIDAAHYCNWRSKRARLTPAYSFRDGGRRAVLDPEADGYRLPIEAEWEFAARNGGRDILFPWGAAASEQEALQFANFTPEEAAIDPWPNTNPVKAFPAAPSGLYGMAGNVCEWCQDMYGANSYAADYRVGDIADLLNPDPQDFVEGKINRVIRGGSFRNPLSSLRCAARAYGFEQVGAPHVGMRLVRNVD